ncbi:hypothetical protein HDU78_009821 [Chytriomyces hyalinus]|nr:hypothetical protein HDU78_009821 [Chytriomyces hyalinus]
MSSAESWLVIVPALVGCAMTVQGALTAKLGAIGGKAFSSCVVLFQATLLALASFLIQSHGGSSIDFAHAAALTPWWCYLGGVLGGYYVFSMIVLLPRIGVALFFIASITLQLISSALFDSFAIAGFSQRSVTPGRAVGIALVFLGCVVVNFGTDISTWSAAMLAKYRSVQSQEVAVSAASLQNVTNEELPTPDDFLITDASNASVPTFYTVVKLPEPAPADTTEATQPPVPPIIRQPSSRKSDLILLIFPMIAGIFLLVQAGMNGTLGANYGYPFASFFSLSTSLLTVLILYAHEYYVKPTDFRRVWRETPWWCYIAGILSFCYVFSSTTLATRLGAAVFLGTVMATQVICATVLDHFGVLGLQVKRLDWMKAAGILVLLVGVVLNTVLR